MDTLDAEINKYIVTRHKEYLANPAGGAVVISNIAGPNFAPVTHVAGIGWDAAKVRDVTSSFLASLAVQVSCPKYSRLSRLAAKSNVTIERWLDAVLGSAMESDEHHWREMADRDAMAEELRVDPLRYARLSNSLRELSPSTKKVLDDMLVQAREQGREEGRRAAASVGLGRRAA